MLPLPLLTSGAPEYSPLLTYSLMANPCRAREAAPSLSRAADTWVSVAARARYRSATVSWSAVTVVMDFWYDCRSVLTFPKTSSADEAGTSRARLPGLASIALT